MSTCEEYKDEFYRDDGVRKTKAKLEFGKTCKKTNTKGIYAYVNQKRKVMGF